MMIEQDFDFEIFDYVIHGFVVRYKLRGLFILQDIIVRFVMFYRWRLRFLMVETIKYNVKCSWKIEN